MSDRPPVRRGFLRPRCVDISTNQLSFAQSPESSTGNIPNNSHEQPAIPQSTSGVVR